MTHTSASGGALTLSWCLVVALMLAARLAAAQSAAEVVRFDLPAQPLEASLAVFGRITGHSVLVASSLTSGREAAAVQGDFAPREALRRMLAGSGLAARYTGANAFTLVPVQAPAADAREQEHNTTANAALTGNGPASLAYAALLQRAITRVLCIAQPDAFGRYRLALQLWIDPAGGVADARLLEGSGVPSRDAAVLASLRGSGLDLEAPPPALAQPVTLLLTPRPDPARDCRPYLGVRAAS